MKSHGSVSWIEEGKNELHGWRGSLGTLKSPKFLEYVRGYYPKLGSQTTCVLPGPISYLAILLELSAESKGIHGNAMSYDPGALQLYPPVAARSLRHDCHIG